jgi:hypothetical protein
VTVTRTAAGISNEHLFYGSEATVYVEGGDSKRPAAVDASVDILFWRGIFEAFAAGRQFHFKAKGGKQTLLQIVNQLENGAVKAVIVCLDRDLDHVRGLRTVPGVIYTWGYSWENDVWSADVVEDVFYILCGVDRNQAEVRAQIGEGLRHFSCALRWAVRADVLMAACGRAIVPRGNFKCVIPPDRGWPTIDRTFLRSCVRAARAETSAVIHKLPSGMDVAVLQDVYGHLLGFFCYRMLASLMKTYCRESISRSNASALAINTNKCSMRPEVLHHYRQQFASLSDD